MARSAVRCRSARLSAAVNPANNATFPIGSIVVQRVAKSLLIFMSKGDMENRSYTNDGSTASESWWRRAIKRVERFRFNDRPRRLSEFNAQLSANNSQQLTALYERRIKREAKMAV